VANPALLKQFTVRAKFDVDLNPANRRGNRLRELAVSGLKS
jgi:hypothetical protein